MAKQAGVIPLIDALFAVKGQKVLDGITDLRPRSNGGEFLYKLKGAESRLARKAGAVPLRLFAVGGKAVRTGLAGALSQRYFGSAENDLVVPLASAAPVAAEKTREVACDHFGYFSAGVISGPSAADAIEFLRSAMFGEAPSEPKPATSMTMRQISVKTKSGAALATS